MDMSKPKAANSAGGLPPEVGKKEPKTFVGQALLDALEHSCTLKQDGMVEAQPIHGSQASKRKNGRRRKSKGTKHLHILLQSPLEQQQHVAPSEPPKAQCSISVRSAENRQALPIRQTSTAHMGWQPADREPARREMSTRYQPMQSRSQNQAYPTQPRLTGQYHGLGQGLWPLPAGLSANAGPFTSSAFMPPSFQYAQQSPLFTPYTPLFHYPTPSFTPINGYHSTAIKSLASRDIRRSAHQPSLQSPPRPNSPPGGQRLVPSDRPEPSNTYLSQAASTPKLLTTPQTLLIISDLNGTLIYRKPRTSKFEPRSGLTDFLTYLFETHKLMVWTSARAHTMVEICSKLFKSTDQLCLVAMWARDMLGLTFDQYNGKTKVYKRLTSVWNNKRIQVSHPDHKNGGRWSQANTLLIDDSIEKAAAQPYNLINIPELTRALVDVEAEQNVLRQVAGYIEEASHWDDVSAFARQKPFRVREYWNREEAPVAVPQMGNQRIEPEL